MNQYYPVPFEAYEPGDFAPIAREPFARSIWDFLTRPEHVDMMIATAEKNQAPILPLSASLHKHFSATINSSPHDNERVKIMVNNMIKQILHRFGYELSACCLLTECPFCSSAGLFTRRDDLPDSHAGEAT